MSTKSRTQYSAKNTSVAMISRIVAILMGFITRVFFTRMLSESYVGVNGLFTDILNVLSLSELGVGTAITYALYKPIAEGDIEKQKSLMRLYRKFYRIIAGTVALLGVSIIPFMDVLIKNKPDVEHLTIIYLLYLANSVFSYLLIYKRTLVDAHQLTYIGILYQTIFLVVQDVLQIIVLVTTKNFILFLCIYIVCTLGGNICISFKADKLYPYMKDKDALPLDTTERRDISKNIKAMLMHKVGNVVVNNTDNLLLSSFVGIVSVGCYSNYYLVIGSIRQVLDQIFHGITASVGNLGVVEDKKRVKEVFDASFFVGQWLYGFATICLFELINPFVEISFGQNYLFAKDIVFVLCINFYLKGMGKTALVFRDSLGLFWFDRYKAVAEALINLVVSIILVQFMGVAGVFIGTAVSTVLTSLWVEPYMLFKHRLEQSPLTYFIRYFIYAVVLACTWLLTDAVCLSIQGNLVWVILGRLVVCILIPNLILWIVYHKIHEYTFLKEKARGLLRK